MCEIEFSFLELVNFLRLHQLTIARIYSCVTLNDVLMEINVTIEHELELYWLRRWKLIKSVKCNFNDLYTSDLTS